MRRQGLSLALLLLPLAPASAGTTTRCWKTGDFLGRAYHVAFIGNPERNLSIRHKRGGEPFSRVQDLGVVVTNGTFFDPMLRALGDILIPGEPPYRPPWLVSKREPGRVVDLRRRWGVGVRRDGTLAIARGRAALSEMKLYLGGAGILLIGGADRSDDNYPETGVPGISFPRDVIERRAGRTALGLALENGETILLIVNVPSPVGLFEQGSAALGLGDKGASVKELAQLMKTLGARDAVFYDGGGASAFAAGPPGAKDILVPPSNPQEDRNPSHIIVKACQ
ncbi:MAG: phosphodiester glycosidase family protein [Elusimicrobia bacterium]|nr:phosphodiester glycosidase family protein [Elusimicrobiota bacterium]